MVRLIIQLVILVTIASWAMAQLGRESSLKYDTQRCTPKVIKRAPVPTSSAQASRKGEKATGHLPVVSFQVLESGDVRDAHLKQSSGFATVDKLALEWIRAIKYNKRPGCGVIESDATVSIHWTASRGQ